MSPEGARQMPGCGQIVEGVGIAEGEIDCDAKPDIVFERALLDHAQGKAEDDARSKCPAGCKIIEKVKVIETKRNCAAGKVTLTYAATYKCLPSA
jgi:hypothetical protein